MAVCLAVLGKDNAPLYVYTAPDWDRLELHSAVHTALDLIEERLSGGKTGADCQRELHLGLLSSGQQLRVFGYVTNTRVKFVIAVDATDVMVRDNEVRSLFGRLHAAYADLVCCPFYTAGRTITSRRFDAFVRRLVAAK